MNTTKLLLLSLFALALMAVDTVRIWRKLKQEETTD